MFGDLLISPILLEALSAQGWTALVILVLAAFLFLTKLLPLEVTALGIPAALYVTGVVEDAGAVLVGFGSQAVIAISAVFIIGAGLQESGLAASLARVVQAIGGRSEVRLMVLISISVAVLSAFMSNAATVAVLIPAVTALCRQADIPPSRLLMPLAFGAILGGNLTLIGTSSNILLGDQLESATGQGFGMFDFAPVGSFIVIAGIAFMAIFGQKLLPSRSTEERYREAQLPQDLARNYGLEKNLYVVTLQANSSFRGKTIAETKIGSRYGISIVMVVRPRSVGNQFLQPAPDLQLEMGDHLYLEGESEAAMLFTLEEKLPIRLPEERTLEQVLSHGLSLAEVILTPRSRALGKSFRDLDFRRIHGLNVIALWRGGEAVRQGLADAPLELGDAFLVCGPPRSIEGLPTDDFTVVTGEIQSIDARRAPIAATLLLVAVIPTFFDVPLAMSALISAVLMLATGCVRLDNFERHVDWRVLFLIMGTIPLGSALKEHNVADAAASLMTNSLSQLGDPAVLAVLFLCAAVVSITSSNAAAAVILAPVAIAVAEKGGPPVKQALLAVGYGCSCAFIVPFAHQCNLMVLGPGGYRTADFVRMGLGISAVVTVTAVIGLSLT